MIERRYDPESGIIYVTSSGLWTAADVDAHYDALQAMMDGLRQEGNPIRVLSDIRNAARQDKNIEDHIRERMEETFHPGDRLVLLTGNDADKFYVRGILGDFAVKAFSSPTAAEIWLFADEV